MPFNKPKTFLVEIDHAIEIPIPFRSVPAHADDGRFPRRWFAKPLAYFEPRYFDAGDAGDDDDEGGTAAGGRRESIIIGDAPSAIMRI